TQFDSGAMQNSGIWLPVAVVFQVLLGPSLHLPLLIGASHSIVAVLLAWALGRAAVSRAFGLTFGALLAASPLQIVWSRLGGIHITAVTYVLLTLWCSYVAGKRRSLVLSVVTGLIMWMSVYQYYAARLAMPLGIAMLLAGLSRSRGPLWRTFTVLLVAAMTLVAIYSALGPDLRALWPSYGAGYVGNKGEKGLDELLTKNVLPVSQEVVTALRRYFLVDRVTGEPPPAGYRWGMQFGGLCLVPVAVLGLV